MNIFSSKLNAPKYHNQILDSRKNDILIVKDFVPREIADYIRILTKSGEFHPSKRSSRVNLNAKIRDDYFFKFDECRPLDSILLPAIFHIASDYYGCNLAFREVWKVGNYLGSKKGFYIPHTDSGGGMNHRMISCVAMLSSPDDYEGGELVFPKHSQEIKLPQYSAAIFPSGILHGVNPTLSGQRQTLLSFMWTPINMQLTPKLATKYVPRAKLNYECIRKRFSVDVIQISGKSNFTNHASSSQLNSTASDCYNELAEFGLSSDQKYLIYLPLKGGYGNQVQYLKQSLIIGKLLNRKVITCPFFPHYTQKYEITSENLVSFDYIFDYANKADIEVLDIHTYLKLCSKIKNAINMIKGYIETPSLPEMIINANFSETIIRKRRFNEPSQVLKNLSYGDQLLAIKSPFSCIKLHDCGIYDCVNCLDKENEFSDINKYINSNLSFSETIKEIANKFTKANFTAPFLSVHLRFPDTQKDLYPERFAKCYGIDIKKLEPLIIDFLSDNNLGEKIFIATNSQKHAKDLFSKIEPVFYPGSDKVYNSFIEQAICMESEIFLGSSVNSFSINDSIHRRSTWSSMVTKMRLNNLHNSQSTYWTELLCKNE